MPDFEMTAKEHQVMVKEIAIAEVERRVEALKEVHDHGYLMFGPSNGATRLRNVIKVTLETELMPLLDPDYFEKAQAGQYAPPLPEVWVLLDEEGAPVERPLPLPGFVSIVFGSQQEAVEYGTAMGLIQPQPDVDPMAPDMTMQPRPELPVQAMPNRWSRLIGLTKYKGKGPFYWEQDDLIRLWNTWGRRQEGAV